MTPHDHKAPRAFSWRRFSLPALLPGSVALLVLMLLAYAGINGLNRVGRQTTVIVGNNLEATVRIAELTARTDALGSELYRGLAQGAGGNIEKATEKVAADAASLTTSLAQYRDIFASPAQAASINQAIAELGAYRNAVLAIGVRMPHDQVGAVAFIGPYTHRLDSLRPLLQEMTDAALADAQRRTALATDTTRATGLYFVVMTLIIAGSIILLAWRFGKRQQSILYSKQVLQEEVAARTQELNAARIEAETALAEVNRTRKQLVDAEQMAALGSLVAGVAHEINTPVGTSLTAATLLEDRTRKFRELVSSNQVKKTDLTRYLDLAGETTGLMLSNIHRAANLIQSFKQVAVDQTSAGRRTFDLAAYLDEILTSLTPRLRQSGMRVDVACPAGIEMDSFPGALSQVVTNFVMNALTHAFADGAAGIFTVQAERAGDTNICLRFTDNGSGIPPENLARIFEPFFTTRRGAGGTGLGLHIVYNIITQQLGGEVSVESTVGVGTRFTVVLPAKSSD